MTRSAAFPRPLLALFSLLSVPACGTDATVAGSDFGRSVDSAVAPDDLAMPLPPMAAAYTALHYDVALDIRTRIATISATLRIDATGNCVTIGFRPPAATGVSLDGAAVPADGVTLDTMKGALTACRPGGALWPAREMVTLTATGVIPNTTIGRSQVGYSTRNDAAGKPFTYLLSWVNGCDHHGACDAQPDRFATFHFTVKHDLGVQVLCPGTVTPGGEDMVDQTTCDFAFSGGPTYSTFGLVASQSWQKVELGTWSGVDVTLYDYPQTLITATLDRKKGAAHMAWLQSLLGPYPYGTALRIVVGPTYWLGFEHPGNVVLSENLVTLAGQLPWTDPLRHTTMHELTHMWAGNHATLAGTYDFFWKESVAEYLTYVFEDQSISSNDGQVTASVWKNEAAASVHYPVPGDMPALFAYYSDAYGEGPMILFRQLETMYSRQAVLDALKSLLSSTGEARALSVDDFRKALEVTTGAQLTDYFNAWVHGTGKPAWPTAKVTTTDLGGGMVQVSVAVKTADGIGRGCAFKVRLDGANNAHYDVPFNSGPSAAPLAPVTVNPGFAVTKTELDPDDQCLIFPSTGPIAPWRPIPVEPWVAPQIAPEPTARRAVQPGHR